MDGGWRSTGDNVPLGDGTTGMIPFAGYQLDEAVLDGAMTVDEFQALVAPQSFATLSEEWQSSPAEHIHLDYIAVDGPEATHFAPYANGAAADPRSRGAGRQRFSAGTRGPCPRRTTRARRTC